MPTKLNDLRRGCFNHQDPLNMRVGGVQRHADYGNGEENINIFRDLNIRYPIWGLLGFHDIALIHHILNKHM
jgi:hypothetical protein